MVSISFLYIDYIAGAFTHTSSYSTNQGGVVRIRLQKVLAIARYDCMFVCKRGLLELLINWYL